MFLKWLPWSGKSTYCRENLSNYLRFNRDDARLANPTLKESQIALIEEKFMKDNVGNDIVIDNCHMSWSYSRKALMAQDLWYDISKIDMFDALFPVEKDNVTKNLYLYLSLHQNNQREWIAKVPESVIYQMFLQNYWSREMLWPTIVVDIDWTIANLEHRKHFINTSPKDHDSFYNAVSQDEPITDVIDIANHLSSEYTMIYVSGRRNQTYRDTKERMDKYWVKYDFILMRSWRDHRPDTEVKEEIYNKCLSDLDIKFVIDDRRCVIDMRKSKGLSVLDVWWINNDF